MKTKAIAAFAVLAMFAVMAVPVGESDAAGDYSDISGKTVIGINKSADYSIVYSNHEFDGKADLSVSITYTAKLTDFKGETVSGGVSPSSGSLEDGISETLTVKAPKTAGKYTLEVSYKAEASYTEDDETKTETVERTDTVGIKVVVPVTLSLTLKNASELDFEAFEVYFLVDGEKAEDSETTIRAAGDGSATVSYDWIADAGKGKHTFAVVPASSGNLVTVEGLGEEHVFYIGDTDSTALIALLAAVLVLVVLIMIWIYRKPVKNYGKPKSRR